MHVTLSPKIKNVLETYFSTTHPCYASFKRKSASLKSKTHLFGMLTLAASP